MTQPSSDTSEALAQLQSELADRRSIVHFARSGVALVSAFIFGAAAGKLFWDSIRLSYLGVAAAVISVACALFALWQYRRASRLLADEHVRFEAMMKMRQALHLDDPSALLPQ